MSVNETNIKGAIISDMKYLLARSLAAISNLDAAQDLLPSIDQRNAASVSELDLMARIAIAKGDIALARQLWGLALSKEPNHPGAMAALRRLSPHWLYLAIARRVCLISAVVIVALLAFRGTVTLFTEPGHLMVDSRNTLPKESVAPVMLSSSSVPEAPNIQNSGALMKEPVTSVASRLSDISGIGVVEDSAGFTITFDEGCFLDGSVIREPARAILLDLSRILLVEFSKITILIEGHTDSVPMHKNSPFSDNYTLGIVRALAVANLIRKESPSLASQLAIRSVPCADGSGLTDEDALPQPQCRTVVIRILSSCDQSVLK